MNYIFVLLVLLMHIFTTTVNATHIDEDLDLNTSYHIDSTKKLTINKIHTVKFIKKNDFLDFGYQSNPIWVRFDIKSQADKKYILSYGKYIVDYLDVYYIKDQKIVKEYKNGIKQKMKVESYLSSSYTFPFELKKNEKLSIVFKVHSSKLVNIPYFIKEERDFFEYSFFDYSLSLIFFSVLFTILITNAVFYLVSKKKIFKNYSLYLAASILFWLIFLGFIKNIEISELHIHLTCIVFYLTILIYSVTFVNFFINLLKSQFYLKKTTYYLKLITYKIFPFVILLRIIYLYIDDENTVYILNHLIFFFNYLLILLMVYMTIIYYIRYKRSPKSILLVWMFKAILFFVFFTNIKFTFFDINRVYIIVEIMVMIETILMSTLIAYYLNLIEGKNKKLKTLYKKYKKVSIENYKLSSIENILNIIIHQCKQPLNSINSIIFNIETTFEKNQLTKELLNKKLNEVEKQTDYMNDTFDHFFKYLTNNKRYQEININKTINETFDLLLARLERYNIHVQIKNPYKNLTIKGYKKDLIQVFLILLNNSIEAFKKNDTIKNRYIYFSVELTVEQKTVIKIIDNAGGIKIKPIEMIFKATVTNKESTGLGLYIAKNLIENMGKKIYCKSENCETIFEIRG